MKPKTIVILMVALCIMIAITFLVNQFQSSQTPAGKIRLGEELFKDLPVNNITGMTIHSSDGKVNLGKSDDKWVVIDKFNYPADFKKISDFVIKLREIKIGRNFESSDASITRLGLKLPDDEKASNNEEKSLRVTFTDKDKNTIADLLIGKTRDTEAGSTGGQYIKKVQESTVYLIDKVLKYTEKKPSDWLDKDLLDVKTEDIQKVEAFESDGKPVYSASRAEKGSTPELQDPPKDKKIKKNEVENVFRAISYLKVDDIFDPAGKNEEMNNPKKIVFSLFDGTIYTVNVGTSVKGTEDKYAIQVAVSYQKPPEKPTVKSDAEKVTPEVSKPETPKPETPTPEVSTPEEKKDEKSPEELTSEAEKLNNKLKGWTYVIPKWKFENFTTKIDEFLEAEKEVEQVSTPPQVEKKVEQVSTPPKAEKKGKQVSKPQKAGKDGKKVSTPKKGSEKQ